MKNLLKVFGLTLGLCFLLIGEGMAQQSVLSGTVVDSQSGEPVPGVSILLKGTVRGTVSDESGNFELLIPAGNQVVMVSYLGYEGQELELSIPYSGSLRIELLPMDIQLGGVEVLSTGYQNIPVSRAAGSFVQVDKDLLERKVSTNLLDRLEDVTSGLIFNKTGDSGRDPISIRGRSTLGRFNQPLIVIDNFPFDGSLEDINPNDVESITVLRDASAASIWGARAGNGVIVISTKAGKKDQPLQVDLTANVNWIEPIDAFWEPKMAVLDYIEVERQLFASGYYSASENSPNNPVLTPVVENLILARDEVISDQEADARIAALGSYDLRNDLNRYLYQSQLNQQYNVGIAGGSGAHSYRMSLGFDDLRKGLNGNTGSRYTLNLKDDFRMLKDKLRVSMAFYGVKSEGIDQNMNPQNLRLNSLTPLYPYARLADEAGNPLEVNTELRESFKREAESQGLMDWAFRPLDEMGRNFTESKGTDWRLNLGASYQLLKGLNLSAKYQYWEKSSNTQNLSSLKSYEARNMINQFTQVDEMGLMSFPVPRAGILNTSAYQASSHSARLQLDYSKEFKDWRWDILAGGELKSLVSQSFSNRYYGYNPELASSQTVDYFTQFARYSNPRSTLNIQDVNGLGMYTDRFLSGFANSSLQWKQRYLLTASLRRDASNLFGVSSNMRAVPLWSAGMGWTLSEESFYNWEKVPFMKVRFSYGYNGNVDRSLTAFTTAQVITFNNLTQVNYAQIINPPNENLRWERIKIANLGLDFESKSGRISGTLEVYNKQGLDLIGQSPFAPSTGITTFSGNTASTQSKGYDISISTLNLAGDLSWRTDWLLSGVREKVTDFELEYPVSSLINYGISGNGGDYFPVVGRPLFAVYSYPWAGLNPETGAPMGYLDGDVSEDYRTIINDADMESVKYHGSARPTTFGSLRNTLSYKGLSLSMNISYRFGYYYRRSSVQYVPILQGQGGHADFGLRWQEPGDESMTQVPSMPVARDAFRDIFYRSSSVLIEKGDHIRLQDIRLSYNFQRMGSGFSNFRHAQVFVYANNLGMIWKATKSDWDPDFGFARPLRSIAVGFKMDF